MDEAIKLKDIIKFYGENDTKVQVLDNINLEVLSGEMVAIMGPSGSGKSTLLNILGCIDKASSGKYELFGQDVTTLNHRELARVRNKKIGFVFQSFNLLQNYSIIDNVALPLTYNEEFKGNIKKLVKEKLTKVRLEKHINKKPNQLSGGQQQRVAIARALVNEPDIILADEPTGALDKKTGLEIIDMFKAINKNGKTIIIVTHDINVANHCSRIINIEDGKVVREAI